MPWETYEVRGGDGTSAVTWSLEGADAGQFTLEGTGMSRTLMFSSAPDFEAPADADGDNGYMVTVKAEAGGEEETVGITINVTDVAELGTLAVATNVTYVRGPHGQPWGTTRSGTAMAPRSLGAWKALTPANSRSTARA